MSHAIGIDDSISSCDCCGKSGLKFTVVVELDNGEIAHYGQVCAGRNTGKTRPQINSEIRAHVETSERAARAEWRAHPAYVAECARFAERDRAGVRPGLESKAFVQEVVLVADAARARIAAKYRVSKYVLS